MGTIQRQVIAQNLRFLLVASVCACLAWGSTGQSKNDINLIYDSLKLDKKVSAKISKEEFRDAISVLEKKSSAPYEKLQSVKTLNKLSTESLMTFFDELEPDHYPATRDAVCGLIEAREFSVASLVAEVENPNGSREARVELDDRIIKLFVDKVSNLTGISPFHLLVLTGYLSKTDELAAFLAAQEAAIWRPTEDADPKVFSFLNSKSLTKLRNIQTDLSTLITQIRDNEKNLPQNAQWIEHLLTAVNAHIEDLGGTLASGSTNWKKDPKFQAGFKRYLKERKLIDKDLAFLIKGTNPAGIVPNESEEGAKALIRLKQNFAGANSHHALAILSETLQLLQGASDLEAPVEISLTKNIWALLRVLTSEDGYFYFAPPIIIKNPQSLAAMGIDVTGPNRVKIALQTFDNIKTFVQKASLEWLSQIGISSRQDFNLSVFDGDDPEKLQHSRTISLFQEREATRSLASVPEENASIFSNETSDHVKKIAVAKDSKERREAAVIYLNHLKIEEFRAAIQEMENQKSKELSFGD